MANIEVIKKTKKENKNHLLSSHLKRMLMLASLRRHNSLSIEYPQDGERISPNHYAFKIHSPYGNQVELSLNSGHWISCRNDSGYYWYDWYHIPKGKHICIVREKLQDGAYIYSPPITCIVD